MPPDRNPTAEVLIADGRRHYSSKRYKPALESFTRAMNRCSCNNGSRRPRCTCKNFEEAASQNESIFQEARDKCNCDAGTLFRKCDSSLHIQALNYRAATFEAMDELVRARKDAEWILELAPSIPDGYLRLGKIARLQKKHEFAWKVYNAGIDACSTTESSQHPALKQLYDARKPLHIKYCRHDPLQLPLDVVQMILWKLDFFSLIRCLRVSKSWRNSLGSPANHLFWRDLDFSQLKIHRPPSTPFLVKLMRNSGNDVRRIIINEARRFNLTKPRFQMLARGAPKLEKLLLYGQVEPVDIEGTAVKKFGSSLKEISLSECEIPKNIIMACLDSLQSLDMYLVLGNFRNDILEWPVMPSMKYLRLDQLHPNFIDLESLIKAFPNLEQLYLDHMQITYRTTKQIVWPRLKVFIMLGIPLNFSLRPISGLSHLIMMNQWRELRHFQFHSPRHYEDPSGRSFLRGDFPFLEGSTDLEKGDISFNRLQSLHLQDVVLDGRVTRDTLAPSLDSETLESIDIDFSNTVTEAVEGIGSCQRLAEFEWLRGCESIRSIGVHNFRFRRHPRDDNQLPLPAFLESFPNLETLEIQSGFYDGLELCTVILEIMKRTKLKRIYQNNVLGVALDELRGHAERAGVELIWGSRPAVWPVPIKGD